MIYAVDLDKWEMDFNSAISHTDGYMSLTKCHTENKKGLSFVLKHDKIGKKNIFEGLAHNLMLCINRKQYNKYRIII